MENYFVTLKGIHDDFTKYLLIVRGLNYLTLIFFIYLDAERREQADARTPCNIFMADIF